MNKGFFSQEETSITRGDEQIKNHVKKAPVFNCLKCGLSNKCNSPKMVMSGEGKLNILIIGEVPGETEDEENTQFVGKSGKLLRKIIKELSYDLDEDFFKTNAVRCHPTDNKTPTGIQISACRKYLLDDIKSSNCKVILALGKTAIDGIIGHRLQGRITGCSMTDWANTIIPDQELEKFIIPTWHPSYILRQGNYESEDVVLRNQLKQSIKNAIEISNKSFYVSNYLSDCIPIYDSLEAIKIIEDFSTKEIIAFDYETTGKKPHREGHKIYSLSISDGLVSYSFPYFNDKKFRQKWLRLLNSDIKKICHNGKFENMWGLVRGGYDDSGGLEINNLYWDTMLGGHSLYNNKRTGLKFYAYIHFGILGYDSEIEQYLEPSSKEEELYGANAFNSIEKAPLDKILKYNALDSLLTYKLYEDQLAKLEPKLQKGVRFFTKGSMALSKLEQNGIVFNEKLAKKEDTNLTTKLNSIEKKILAYSELKKWDKEKQFRVSAPADITHLLFDIMKYSIKDKTATGRAKSDIEALRKYKLPIVKDCLEWRKWQKVYNTYLKGFEKENISGVIRALYNLNMVDTFRSSSDSPNFQNIPKHDEEVAKLLRKLLGPRKGNKLGEYDYGAMEVKIIACCNKDPNLIKYIESGKDPHRGFASKLYLMPVSEVMKNVGISKNVRYVTKNSFIFPTFYGSWYKKTSVELWNNCERETRNYLKEQGIKTVEDYTNHVQKVENEFWNEFHVGYDWKEKTVKEYEKNGYVDTLNGFRYQAPMSHNQILNYQVQGPAFHCLLWTLTQVQKELEKRNMKTIIDGQVHDSIYPDFPPEEEDELDYIIWNYGTQKIRKHWDWLIVPLAIEKSVSEINGSWAEMNTIGILNGK
jgi:uracil-DNA glycosylase family 4